MAGTSNFIISSTNLKYFLYLKIVTSYVIYTFGRIWISQGKHTTTESYRFVQQNPNCHGEIFGRFECAIHTLRIEQFVDLIIEPLNFENPPLLMKSYSLVPIPISWFSFQFIDVLSIPHWSSPRWHLEGRWIRFKITFNRIISPVDPVL